MNLASLAYDMRAAGIKSLAIELEDDVPTVPMSPMERDTMAPPEGDQAPPKEPGTCVEGECQSKAVGILGGIGRQYCRTHALQRAGVHT
jgi:hypothetical protein